MFYYYYYYPPFGGYGDWMGLPIFSLSQISGLESLRRICATEKVEIIGYGSMIRRIAEELIHTKLKPEDIELIDLVPFMSDINLLHTGSSSKTRRIRRAIQEQIPYAEFYQWDIRSTKEMKQRVSGNRNAYPLILPINELSLGTIEGYGIRDPFGARTDLEKGGVRLLENPDYLPQQSSKVIAKNRLLHCLFFLQAILEHGRRYSSDFTEHPGWEIFQRALSFSYREVSPSVFLLESAFSEEKKSGLVKLSWSLARALRKPETRWMDEPVLDWQILSKFRSVAASSTGHDEWMRVLRALNLPDDQPAPFQNWVRVSDSLSWWHHLWWRHGSNFDRLAIETRDLSLHFCWGERLKSGRTRTISMARVEAQRVGGEPSERREPWKRKGIEILPLPKAGEHSLPSLSQYQRVIASSPPVPFIPEDLRDPADVEFVNLQFPMSDSQSQAVEIDSFGVLALLQIVAKSGRSFGAVFPIPGIASVSKYETEDAEIDGRMRIRANFGRLLSQANQLLDRSARSENVEWSIQFFVVADAVDIPKEEVAEVWK